MGLETAYTRTVHKTFTDASRLEIVFYCRVLGGCMRDWKQQMPGQYTRRFTDASRLEIVFYCRVLGGHLRD